MKRRIRILTPIGGTGPRGPWSYDAGQIVRLGVMHTADEIPAELGLVLADGVRAEFVETATIEPPEVAALRRAGPRVRGPR